MMYFDMTIDVDNNITDPLAMGNVSVVGQILDIAEKVTQAGHKVTIQRTYENAAPDVLAELKSPADVQGLRDRLNANQTVLGGEQIA